MLRHVAGGAPPPGCPGTHGTPTLGNNGSTFLNSGAPYEADAPGRNYGLTLTLTKPGTFGFLDVAYAILGMRGNLIVRPSP